MKSGSIELPKQVVWLRIQPTLLVKVDANTDVLSSKWNFGHKQCLKD